MKKYIILPLFLIFLLLGSCTSYDELDRSVFKEDVNCPGLPEYSEWGYNTFGAYIDRSAFVSNDDDLPGKIIVISDTFNIRFAGSWKANPLTLKFSIKGFHPSDYPDLLSLNDSVFDLTDSDCQVSMTYHGRTEKLNVFQGQLHFMRVQNLYVDKVLTESILSGYFNFKTFYGGEPIAVSNGRFDLGFGYDNFYKY